MPALYMSVGLVVNPRMYWRVYNAAMSARSAPSAYSFTRRSAMGVTVSLVLAVAESNRSPRQATRLGHPAQQDIVHRIRARSERWHGRARAGPPRYLASDRPP